MKIGIVSFLSQGAVDKLLKTGRVSTRLSRLRAMPVRYWWFAGL